MGGTLYRQIKYLNQRVTTSHELSDSQKERMDLLSREIEDREKKRIIESFKLNGTIERIISGDESFRNLGQPIIDRCLEVEAEYSEKRFGKIKRDDILGNDARADVYESVQFLRDQDIIDANTFFPKRYLIIPGTRGLANFVQKNFGFGGLGTFCMISTGIAGCISIAQKISDSESAIGAGSISGVALAFTGWYSLVCNSPFISSDTSLLAQDRIKFEEGITYLDSEIARLYSDRQ